MSSSSSPSFPPARVWSRLTGALRAYERSQFGRPRGPIGQLVGAIMAIENWERNAWAVELLAVQPGERVLEIGCGPGVAIDHIVRTTAAALVVGVDHSAAMIGQARRRNAAAVASGRVELRRGELARLPCDAAAFDRVLLVNALHFSTRLVDDLAEVRRVLRPGGQLTIVVQPVWVRTAAAPQHAEQLVAALGAADFDCPVLQYRALRPVPAIGVLATRPATGSAAASGLPANVPNNTTTPRPAGADER